MSIGKTSKTIFQMVFRNCVPLLYFEIVYKTIGFTVIVPFLQYLLSSLPGIAGVDYISQENLRLLLAKPAALFIIILILIVLGLYILYEVTAFMIVCEMGWRNKRISVFYLWKEALIQTIGLLSYRKIGVFLMLPMLMLSIFSFISGYLNAVRIPEYILEFILGHAVLFSIYAILVCTFHALLFLYVFGMPALLFSGKGFIASWRESLNLLRGRKLRIAVKIFAIPFICMIGVLTAGGCVIAMLGFYTKNVYSEEAGKQLFQFYLVRGLQVFGIFTGILASVFLCAAIIFFYHTCRKEARPQTGRPKSRLKKMLFQPLAAVGVVCCLIFFSETEIGGNVLLPGNMSPSIIAHRAGAAWAPENTLAALSNAIQDGADAAEIDIQQLGDGTLVVMHDTNFQRTTGLDLDVWNADRKMVANLDAGSYFDEQFRNEKVPTLEEFLEHAGEQIKLMIELKTTGYEKNLEQNILQTLDRYPAGKHCMIASMNLDTLRRVKELEPKIETVYISAILITNRFDLTYVDSYSVETTAISRGMVAQAHLQEKKIYAWTANSENTIRKILQCGGDGIITDNPLLAESNVEQYGRNLLVEEITSLFYS